MKTLTKKFKNLAEGHKFTLLLIIILASLAGIKASQNYQRLLKVQNGELTLLCATGNDWGRIKVEPQKVTGYFFGTWEFTNGSANNCRLLK